MYSVDSTPYETLASSRVESSRNVAANGRLLLFVENAEDWNGNSVDSHSSGP